MLWSKNHIIALVIIAAVLYAMHRFSGLKIWHALVVLAIGAYLTAFIFGPQITAFLSRGPRRCSGTNARLEKEKNHMKITQPSGRRARPAGTRLRLAGSLAAGAVVAGILVAWDDRHNHAALVAAAQAPEPKGVHETVGSILAPGASSPPWSWPRWCSRSPRCWRAAATPGLQRPGIPGGTAPPQRASARW